jgi:hypothetical protein
MYYLFSVYFVNKPLHVSSINVAHHQDIYIYIYIYTTRKNGFIYDELQMRPKHVGVDWGNKLKINIA